MIPTIPLMCLRRFSKAIQSTAPIANPSLYPNNKDMRRRIVELDKNIDRLRSQISNTNILYLPLTSLSIHEQDLKNCRELKQKILQQMIMQSKDTENHN